jgi:uncharacterized protein (TIGR02266 family)
MRDTHERRRETRWPLALDVRFASEPTLLARTENVSQGGLFVRTEHRWAPAERVLLTVSSPGGANSIEIEGRVAWTRPRQGDRPSGIGISAETQADRQRLSGLLSVSGAGTEPRTVGGTQTTPEGGYRVLIIEDNPHIVEMYAYALKKLAAGDLRGKAPLEVNFAADGHLGLQMIQEREYHLLMLDLYMPVMDGFAVVEKLRQDEKHKNIPIIAISAGGKDAQQRAMDLGVDVFLRKPVKFVEVLETVKQLLRIP